ncbi:MAG: AAA-like domain-containing protein [Candidatus Electrothrix sp. Rat3]|nr:AAA-like domain-containing protein [Candidatus Electrothrix rattekaaiensis]
MGIRERLQSKRDDLQEHWELLRNKLGGLERDRILETRSEEGLRLGETISKLKERQQVVEEELEDVEQQLLAAGCATCATNPQTGIASPMSAVSNNRERILSGSAGTLEACCLEMVGGAVPLDSQYYIVRSADTLFDDAISRKDSIVLIKGARQVGKTSLLARGLDQARKNSIQVALTDFQKLATAELKDLKSFYLALGEILADALDLEVSPEDVWKDRRSPNANFERYLKREVLAAETPLIWAMDEVDRLFSCPFGSEVFALFRSWHNERALNPATPFSRLTLAIAYATEAHLFIRDLNQSPFNVGTRLFLADFTSEQVADLNRRYGSPVREQEELHRFYQLLGGQPYLIRRGFDELVSRRLDVNQLAAEAAGNEGIFGDHLRRILVMLGQDQELCAAVRALLLGKDSPDFEIFYRLRSAGILRGESGKEAELRCEIYTTYLKRHLL